MPLPGGASDKAGLRYELLWTVRCLVRLMKGEFASIWLEPAGEEGEGVEFAITTNDGVEYHQVKRQLTGKGVWSLSELSKRGVLSHFYRKLGDSSATCTFVSSHAAHPLEELTDRAVKSGTWAEFQRNFVSSDAWDDNFNSLHIFWNSPSKEDTYERLLRLEVTTINEISLREWVEDGLESLVNANPATVRSVLSDFALNQTHRKLTSGDIWAHLKSHGFGKLTSREDEEVNETIAEINEAYLAGAQPVGIGGEIISRAEVSRILANFDDDQSGNIALVTGKAGVGKSSVIAQTLGAIDGRGWPLLVLRVDRLEPSTTSRELGRQLGLPASPVSVLANLANGRECLLVIDQLDAVSLASGRNPDFFDCIGAMISQAQLHPNMRVLAACRKFDVDNDHRIREIVRNQDTATEIPLTEFDEATVREIVAKLGKDAGSLNPKQIELLSLPVHLRLLAELPSVKAGSPLGFQTAKELYDAFWNEKKRVLRERVYAARIKEVADLMAKSMSERQALSVPTSLLDEHTEVVDLMASENILVKDDAQVSFFHESFFDYIFARRMVEDDFDAVHFIFGQGQILLLRLLRTFVPTRKGQSMVLRLLRALFSVREKQSLFVRSQLRQVLLHQRDVYPKDALHNMEKILKHPDIRPHLKDIVLAMLGSLDDPTEDEWHIALEPMLHTELSEQAWRAIYGSVAWFDVLDSIGVIKQWLDSSDEELLNRTILLLRSIHEKRADRVAELVSPFLGVSEHWNQRLLDLLVYPKIAASRSFYDFVIKAIKQGIIDDLFVSGNRGFGTWYGVEEALETNPLWACELVACYCDRLLVMARQKRIDSPFPQRASGIREDVMKKVAEAAPREFAKSLLPFLFQVVEMSADHSYQPPLQDSVWGHGVIGLNTGADNAFLMAMEYALRWLAATEPDAFRIYARGFRKSNYATIQNLLLRAYEADGKRYADESVEYLLEDFHARYSVGRVSTSSDHAVCQLIEAISPYCSPKNLEQLEQAILAYYPDYEKDFDSRRWLGGAQMELLERVESSRLSDNGRQRLQELRRKFAEVTAPVPGRITGGMVGSPIPASAIRKMTDDNWLQAMARYSSDRLSNAPRDWLKGSARQLARDLETQTKEDPARFASLIHRMPDDANRNYFEAILRGIADSGLDMDAVVDVCLRCHEISGRPFGRSITAPLTQFSEAILPVKALRLVAWYATNDPDPSEDKSTRTVSVSGEKRLEYDPLFGGINSVRGTATLTLAKLIFQNERYLSFFKPYLKNMVRADSDAVRACVAEALVGALLHDRNLAVDLFLELCDTDERLLATLYFERFLYYAKQTHFKELRPILTRMVNSEYEEVSTAGARQVCLASLGMEEAIPLARQCLSGSVAMKKGSAEIYAANLRNSANRAKCEEALIRLFSDGDAEVREIAARCFRDFEGRELQDYKELVQAFIQIAKFEPGFYTFIRALRDTTAHMPNETLLACERHFELAGTSAGDVRTRTAAYSRIVMSLILRVYGKATDDGVKSRCLDLIDKAKLLGADGVDGVEAAFDR